MEDFTASSHQLDLQSIFLVNHSQQKDVDRILLEIQSKPKTKGDHYVVKELLCEHQHPLRPRGKV